MRISVIIPNFNHGVLIERAIRSILEQKPPPIEIIIVDDCSTDDSVSIIKSLLHKYDKLTLIELTQNIGAVNAVSYGVKISKGDYLFFAAADDLLLSDAFTEILKAYVKYPKQSFYCGEVEIRYEGSKRKSYRPVIRPANRIEYIDSKKYSTLLSSGDNYILTMASVINKGVFLEFGGFDTNFEAAADAFFCRKIALSKGFVFIPEILTVWNVSLSGSSRGLMQNQDASLNILALVINKIEFESIFPVDYSKKFKRRWLFGCARINYEIMRPSLGNNFWMFGLNPLQRTLFRALLLKWSLGKYFYLIYIYLKFRPYFLFPVIFTCLTRVLTKVRKDFPTWANLD